MTFQALPLLRKHFPEVNKSLSYNSEHTKQISNAVFKVKPCDFARFLREFSDFAPKSAIFRFCMGGIPPRNRAQSRYFGKITAEMKRSRAVRIQNIKFCNFPISMKKVMTRSLWTKKNFFLAKKKFFSGREWIRTLITHILRQLPVSMFTFTLQ